MSDNKYIAYYDKRGKAACKKCKDVIGKDSLRIAKVTPSPFGEDAQMKQFYHVSCMFETFKRTKATTKIIDDISVLDSYETLKPDDQAIIRTSIEDIVKKRGIKPTSTKPKPVEEKPKEQKITTDVLNFDLRLPANQDYSLKDNSFRQFRKVCSDISDVSGYLDKTQVVRSFLRKGTSGDGFEGDLHLFLSLLLPGTSKRVYNVSNKQIIKVFSQLFESDHETMTEHLTGGDVAETVKEFFEDNSAVTPARKSTLNIREVEDFLEALSRCSKEEPRFNLLKTFVPKCTTNDLCMIVRLIKHDLRINAGPKHILEALDAKAYEAFQASKNLSDVIDRVLNLQKKDASKGKDLKASAKLMTPVAPMLAEPCRSVAMALKKCPNGMFAEVKYDGERVQLHKNKDTFSFYTRNLKPVLSHKIDHFRKWIPEAFPAADNLILDCEILLIDTNTSKPLPFGTLGVHKKAEFKDANVCLFVFDCLHYNDENLMDKSIRERRKYLLEVINPIANRVLVSEANRITKAPDLKKLIAATLNEGLEGLVLKDLESTYEPGKRHWLKVKKDYLSEGKMADSADLVVLGAYFGSGSKGGIMSIFLMGCYNSQTKKFVTVTKCGNGFDDKKLDSLQKELKTNMRRVNKSDPKIPSWLNINKGKMMPDFLVNNPKESPVWEISGAEFSKAAIHTADGISIRFPRVVRVRDDKSWKEATDLDQLKELVKISKERTDWFDLLGAPSSPPERRASDSVLSKQSKRSQDSVCGSASAPSCVGRDVLKEGGAAKRASVDEGDQRETKRKKTAEKALCVDGSECSRNNPEHLTKYSHGERRATTASSSGVLPNVFSGCSFYVSDEFSSEERRRMERYILAYDGDLIQDGSQRSSASHMILTRAETSSDFSGKARDSQWFWKCVSKKSLENVSS